MPVERYFINESLVPQSKIVLKGTEFHHLAHVMRARKGETIELINGFGALAYATIQELLKEQAYLTIDEVISTPPRLMQVILAQALPRLNRLDFILEKGTELGVDEFWLFPSQHSVKKEISLNQLERFHALTVAAMKQCGRLFLPKIIIKPSFHTWPTLEGTAFFGDVEAQAVPFETKWKEISPVPPLIFFVGPESGFTDKEVLELRERGVQGVKLHEHILRTDTAPLMALSLIEHWLMLKNN